MTPTLRLALALAAAMCQSGCAVGYIVVSPEADLDRTPRADWSTHAFTVEGDARDRFATERALFERYGVLHLRAGTREEGAFHLTISRVRDHGLAVSLIGLPFLASYATFAVIPGYAPEWTNIAFALQGPDGESFTATGHLREGLISWLPLILLAPTVTGPVNFRATLHNPGLAGDLQQTGASEALAAEFFRSAEPFVARRRAASETPP